VSTDLPDAEWDDFRGRYPVPDDLHLNLLFRLHHHLGLIPLYASTADYLTKPLTGEGFRKSDLVVDDRLVSLLDPSHGSYWAL
jgi:hypothetical protein